MSGTQSLFDRLSDNRFTKPAKRAAVRTLVCNLWTRPFVNAFYRSLNDGGKSKYHGRYASMFADSAAVLAPGQWKIDFLGATLSLPLRSDQAWLDWDLAVAILGHDLEVKQTYAEILQSADRPEIFLDVGANYGTHTLLFRAAGIQTISFEPNERCTEYFKLACRLNGFDARWEPIALGDRHGSIELVFPDRKTWHGSVVVEVVEALKREQNVVVKQVPLKMLDDYYEDVKGKRVVMKIDVEGAEQGVLKGAVRLLQEVRPMIVFESNQPERRADLYALFARHAYAIEELPWKRAGRHRTLSADAFRGSQAGNFLALSRAA